MMLRIERRFVKMVRLVSRSPTSPTRYRSRQTECDGGVKTIDLPCLALTPLPRLERDGDLLSFFSLELFMAREFPFLGRHTFPALGNRCGHTLRRYKVSPRQSPLEYYPFHMMSSGQSSRG